MEAELGLSTKPHRPHSIYSSSSEFDRGEHEEIKPESVHLLVGERVHIVYYSSTPPDMPATPISSPTRSLYVR
jgi:hypothetical protein